MIRLGSLCTGYGGLDMAIRTIWGNAKLVWWSDVDSGAIAVNERHEPGVPNIGDVKTVDWSSVPPVDILSAGYPCQPFSQAGKRLGSQDPRHLWPHIAVGIGCLRPAVVVLENVDGHVRRGLDVVVGDLAGLGYDAVWTTVRASDVGAPHRRQRLFVLAADTAHAQWKGAWHVRPKRGVEHPDGGGESASVAPGDGRHERRSEPARLERRPDAAVGGGEPAPDAVRGGRGRDQGNPGRGAVERAATDGDSPTGVDWGIYAAAVRRWELITGVPAPHPVTTGRRGARVLAPELPEWMMGVPAGHITDTPGLSRNQQLRLAGNGVMPVQAEHAIRELMSMWNRWAA
jgi:DNA (cytosine-5)-methyltransferase 1